MFWYRLKNSPLSEWLSKSNIDQYLLEIPNNDMKMYDQELPYLLKEKNLYENEY